MAVPGPAAPDHSTMSCRAQTLAPLLARPGSARVHLPVDGTGLTLHGSGEWLLERHGTRTCRSRRRLGRMPAPSVYYRRPIAVTGRDRKARALPPCLKARTPAQASLWKPFLK